MVARLGEIPLLYQPGTKWHYSIAADVLGRLIEVVSGQPFDAFLNEQIFQPLGMDDTGFYVPQEKIDRFASMSGPKPEGGLQTIDAPEGGTGHVSKNSFIEKPKFLSAGGGLVSTAADFARFCLMLSGGGTLDGKRLLRSESVELMTRNHLPTHLIPLDKKPDERYNGLGFGLGVSVRVQQTNWIPASQVSEYGWIGGTSTEFWVSPRDELVAIVLAQHIPFSELSEKIKPLVYAAIFK
jgi:CubicO group peptidase (beta-lactamase class C family)